MCSSDLADLCALARPHLADPYFTLHAAAEKHGVDLYYEASVAGAIPLLRPLRESLAGDKVRRVLGIVTPLYNESTCSTAATSAGSPP